MIVSGGWASHWSLVRDPSRSAFTLIRHFECGLLDDGDGDGNNDESC